MQKNSSGALINDLTQGPLARQLITFALPFIGANILQVAYNIVDMAVVGHFVGSGGLSAVSIGGQIIYLLNCLSVGASNGGQVLVAQIVGSGNLDRLKKCIGTIFSVLFIAAAAATLLGFFALDASLDMMNTPPEAYTGARSYLAISVAGLIFTYGYNAVCSILRGMGDSKRPLIFILIASLVNLVLDFVFVGGFGMGTAGAALATVISQACSFLFAIAYLYRRREGFHFDFRLRSFRIDGEMAALYAKLGLPMALQYIAINFSVLYCNSRVNAYGVVASATGGIGYKLFSVTTIISSSIQVASTSIIGQNIASGNIRRCKKTVFIGWGFALAAAMIFSGVCLLAPRAIFGIFNNEPEVLAMAPVYLRIAVVGYIADALMNPPLALMYGVGAVAFNFAVAMLDGVVARIGLSLLFGKLFGLTGYWLGSSCAAYVTVIFASIYFFSGAWKKRRLLSHAEEQQDSL